MCRDGSGRVLLVRASGLSHFPGRWFLPGGGVDHGEHPEGALRREVLEETALDVRVRSLRTVLSDVTTLPDDGSLQHTVRLVYDVEILGGAMKPERDGTTDVAKWCRPNEWTALPLMPFVATVLSSPGTPVSGVHHVEIYVRDLERSTAFWRPLLDRLGWTAYQSWPAGRSWRLHATYLVLVQVTDDHRRGPAYDRRRVGLNHLALHAGTPEQVETLVRQLGVPLLYADRHPYAGGPDHYAAYVEDPDGIKVELVATAPG